MFVLQDLSQVEHSLLGDSAVLKSIPQELISRGTQKTVAQRRRSRLLERVQPLCLRSEEMTGPVSSLSKIALASVPA
jgi:hypothetical protein